MAKPLRDCRITVIGLGLMGASLCMDLTQNNLCREVRGVARRSRIVLDAFFDGAVDLATNDLHTGVMGADIVILATPVRTIIRMLDEIGPYLWPGAIVMDMGSTKGDICAAMNRMPDAVQPIGGHPMTGKEVAGFTAAEPGLYRGATWVLTPLDKTSEETVDVSVELVEAVGACPVVLPSRRHDRLVATISHLPYLLASALVHTVSDVGAQDPTVWKLAAGGFRDTSRVAAGETQMFLDILMTNRTAILEQIDGFAAHLDELRHLIDAAGEDALRQKLEQSREARVQWNQSGT